MADTGEIQTVMKELFEIPALEETWLWIKDTSNTDEQLSRLDITIDKARTGCPKKSLQ